MLALNFCNAAVAGTGAISSRTAQPPPTCVRKGAKAEHALAQAAKPLNSVIHNTVVTQVSPLSSNRSTNPTPMRLERGRAPLCPPSSVTGIDIHRIVGGKIKETWINRDALGMLQQLGLSSQ
jgi:hypothetical protein